MIDFFVALFLGIVEGVTEFLPISSTGHLILVQEFLGTPGIFANKTFSTAFDVIIQLGAIISVLVYFHKKLIPKISETEEDLTKCITLWGKAIIGVLPALMLGFFFRDDIYTYLFSPVSVAYALIFGGIVMIALEQFLARKSSRVGTRDLSWKMAFAIGIFQCFALIPGMSRSASTIIGAMFLGASRIVAAEYSFFLALPTMFAASGYTLLKLLLSDVSFTLHMWLVLLFGSFVSFAVAYAVIAFFMNFLGKHDFQVFGWYRIVLGIGVILLLT